MAHTAFPTRQIEEAISRADAEAASLRDQAAEIETKLAEIEVRRIKLLHTLEVMREFAAPDDQFTAHQSLPPPDVVRPDAFPADETHFVPQRQAYGIWTAAVKICIELLQTTGRPWHTKEFLAELRRRGFSFTVSDPVSSLSNKLARNEGLRSNTKLGWHLVEWPKPETPELSGPERLELLRTVFDRKDNQEPSAKSNVVELVPFHGQGLPQAAVGVLTKAAAPMGNFAIAEHLAAAGYPFNQKDRENAVEAALRRRSNSEGDVIRVAAGTWGITARYSDDELQAFASNLGGVPGRDVQAHLERTRAAVQAAKQRGVRFGIRPTLDDEGMARVKRMLTDGMDPKSAASALGVSLATVHRWIKKWTHEELTGAVDLTNPNATSGR